MFKRRMLIYEHDDTRCIIYSNFKWQTYVVTLKSKMMRTIRLNDLNSHLNFYKKYLDLSINESSILIQSTFFVLSTLTRQFCSYNQFTRFFFVSFYKILYQVFFEHDEKINNPWKGLIKSLLILLSTLITCKHYFSRFHLILSLSRETEIWSCFPDILWKKKRTVEGEEEKKRKQSKKIHIPLSISAIDGHNRASVIDDNSLGPEAAGIE